MNEIMYHEEKDYTIKAKGKNEEEVIGKIFTILKKTVTSDIEGIVIKLEPVNVYELSKKTEEYTETFLWFFMPRKKQEIEIEALPTDLIDSFVIDVSEVTEIGKAFTMADLSFDKEKIEIVDFDPEEPIVKIDYATMEEATEEVDEEAAMESLEATQEKAKDKEEDS